MFGSNEIDGLNKGVWTSPVPHPPLVPNIVQWLNGTNGLTLSDKIGTLSAPEIVDVPCVTFDGVSTQVKVTAPAPSGVFSGRCWVWYDGGSIEEHFVLQRTTSNVQNAAISHGTGTKAIRLTVPGNVILTTAAELIEDDWNYIEWYLDATSSQISLNGVLVSGSGVALQPRGTTYLGSNGVGGVYFAGKMKSVVVDGVCDLLLEETTGTVCYNRLDPTANGVLTSASILDARAGTAEGIEYDALKNGFTLSGGVQIPADPALNGNDVLGNPLTNLGGYISNGAQCSYIQTDPSLLNRGDGFWVTAGAFVKRTASEWFARTNKTQDQADKIKTINTVDYIKESILYDENTINSMTPAELAKLDKWIVG